MEARTGGGSSLADVLSGALTRGALVGRKRHAVAVRIRRIVPDVRAEDPAASREFYEQILGLRLVMDHGWILTFAAPDNLAAQIRVMKHDASASVEPDVSIEVDDVDEAHAAAQRLGYEILHLLTDERMSRGAFAASSCATQTARF